MNDDLPAPGEPARINALGLTERSSIISRNLYIDLHYQHINIRKNSEENKYYNVACFDLTIGNLEVFKLSTKPINVNLEEILLSKLFAE